MSLGTPASKEGAKTKTRRSVAPRESEATQAILRDLGPVACHFLLGLAVYSTGTYAVRMDVFLYVWHPSRRPTYRIVLELIGGCFIIALVLMTIRNLAVGIIRREGKRASAYIVRFQRRLCVVLLVQVAIFVYGALLTFKYAPVDQVLGPMAVGSFIHATIDRCLVDVNASYVASWCSQSWDFSDYWRDPGGSIILFPGRVADEFTWGTSQGKYFHSPRSLPFDCSVPQGGKLVCDDGGVGVYRSLYDACLVAIASRELMVPILLCTWMGAQALFLLFIPEIITSLDGRLTLSNIFTRAEPRASAPVRMAAALTLVVCALIVAELFAMTTQTAILNLILTTNYVFVLVCFILAVEFLIRRFKDKQFMDETEESEMEAKTKVEEGGEQSCSFWFVPRETVLAWKAGNIAAESYPTFQALRKISDPRKALRRIKILEMEAFSGQMKDGDGASQPVGYGVDDQEKYYTHQFCVVSHRWFDKHEPDRDCTQLRVIQEHLNSEKGRWVEWVWYDYWCMPQGKKSLADKIGFDWMLGNINLLYLAMPCLILLDLSYISRFWTQFEAWLSMQTATMDGLRPAVALEQRFTIVPIYNTNENLKAALVAMWAKTTPEKAYGALKQPDVTVTNQSDKDAQLPKILSFNDRVKDAFRRAAEQRREYDSLQHLLAV